MQKIAKIVFDSYTKRKEVITEYVSTFKPFQKKVETSPMKIFKATEDHLVAIKAKISERKLLGY